MAGDPYVSPGPCSPWDRGSKGCQVKETMTAMMARLAQRKPDWTAPTLEERDLCGNCDGASDGGHADDEVCRRTLEEM